MRRAENAPPPPARAPAVSANTKGGAGGRGTKTPDGGGGVSCSFVFVSRRQMSEPHTGLTLKCAKCGVVSTTALSATTASNAM